MATTPVQMKVEGFAEREVLMVMYRFNQATDPEGQMAGNPRGGRITVRCKALNDGNPELLKWMTTPDLAKNGSIVFHETKTGNLMKTLEFTDGYCIDFLEYWEDMAGHYEEITISCREIKLGPVSFQNKWA